MYAIEISSKTFEGLSVIKQHRLVNDLLQDDIKKMHGIRVIIERKLFFLRFFFSFFSWLLMPFFSSLKLQRIKITF